MNDEGITAFARLLEADLLKLYGSPILTLKQLSKALNYPSIAAVKQSIYRQTLPVNTFELPNRRGKYVLVKDVAQFLAEQAFLKKE